MFSENEIKAYRSVTAPVGLGTRITEQAKESKRGFARRTAPAAAAFGTLAALAFCLVMALKPFAPNISIMGEELQGSVTVAMADMPAPAMSRSIVTARFTFQVELAPGSRISVNFGSFSVEDEKGSLVAQNVQTFAGKGNYSIIWDTVPTDGENCEMDIRAPFSKDTVTVYHDEESGTFALERH